jgi:imidazole glycerol-phosphate synthase subunit HisH
MIGIVDYGIGNIRAISNIYKKLDTPHKIVSAPEQFEKIEKIILPGVGAFDHAMICLKQSGLIDSINDIVLNKRKPVLGICVGMQMMANSSEEGSTDGLGWIDSTVEKIIKKVNTPNIVLPHMGWNSVKYKFDSPLFRDIDLNSRFYFLHSYYFNSKNKNYSIATTKYGSDFTCAVNKNNIFGVQFHPEKSHHDGVQLLKNFSTL